MMLQINDWQDSACKTRACFFEKPAMQSFSSLIYKELRRFSDGIFSSYYCTWVFSAIMPT